jgi:peptidoglycan/LPS O-acetylase OafA/YrhL
LAASIAGVIAMLLWQPGWYGLLCFSCGMTAALLARSSRICAFAIGRLGTVLVLSCLGSVVTFFPSAYGVAPALLLALGFALIACGNTLFGALIHPASRMLGQMSYSVYLLHGLWLFVIFNILVGTDKSKTLPVLDYWSIVLGITPLLVASCFLTFRLIESPAIRRIDKVMAWIRANQFGLPAKLPDRGM